MAGGDRDQMAAARAVRRRQAVAAKQQAERAASSLPARIAAAAAGPVVRCLRTAKMQEAGIGHVVLARRLPAGTLGCAFFLVDLFCLGVKDAFYRELAPSELDAHVARLSEVEQTAVPIDPASAEAVVRGAVAFAARLGLAPAKSYPEVVRIFDGLDEAAATERFAFGRDGRPLYVPGPRDSSARVREIERVLTRAVGDGWDVDPIGGLPTAQRVALHGIAARLGERAGGGGPVTEHEGPTDAAEDAAPEA